VVHVHCTEQQTARRWLLARGRDAVDAAIGATFGPNRLRGVTIWTEEIPDTAGPGEN